MTPDEAAARLRGHLIATLRALPAGTTLARRHPDLPKAVWMKARLGRFLLDLADVEEDDDPLATVAARYWVVGPSPAESDRYFELVLEAWRASGRPAEVCNKPPLAALTELPDGCTLTITQTLDGRCLSMSAETPRFRPGPDDGTLDALGPVISLG